MDAINEILNVGREVKLNRRWWEIPYINNSIDTKISTNCVCAARFIEFMQ